MQALKETKKTHSQLENGYKIINFYLIFQSVIFKHRYKIKSDVR